MALPTDLLNIIYKYKHNLIMENVRNELKTRKYICSYCLKPSMITKYNECRTCGQCIRNTICVCRTCEKKEGITNKCIACFTNNVRTYTQYNNLTETLDLIYENIRLASPSEKITLCFIFICGLFIKYFYYILIKICM